MRASVPVIKMMTPLSFSLHRLLQHLYHLCFTAIWLLRLAVQSRVAPSLQATQALTSPTYPTCHILPVRTPPPTVCLHHSQSIATQKILKIHCRYLHLLQTSHSATDNVVVLYQLSVTLNLCTPSTTCLFLNLPRPTLSLLVFRSCYRLTQKA